MTKKIMILGGDGYIGWSLGIQRAFNTNDDIFLVDSYKKRNYQKTLDISELYTTPLLSEKIYLYELITGKHNLKSLSINVANGKSVDSLIDSYKPDVILNAAHQPSAPLSMKSPQYARETLQNNEMSCLNVLWAVHNHCPNSLVINIYIYEYSSNIFRGKMTGLLIPNEFTNGSFLSRDKTVIVGGKRYIAYRISGGSNYNQYGNCWFPLDEEWT